jgi:hypothetical protein
VVNLSKGGVSLGKPPTAMGKGGGLVLDNPMEIMADIEAIVAAAEGIGEDVFPDVAEDIVARARDLCPDDPETQQGYLRQSIRATGVTTKEGLAEISVLAGGDSLPRDYAMIVHEDLTMRHPHGGQAKFLEQPVLEEAPRVDGAIDEAIAKRVGN